MGILLPNYRRRVEAEIGGRKQSSLETVAAIKDGTMLRITDGRETGSRVDGSEYVVAHVQVKPGSAIRVAGYGAEQIAALRAIKQGETFSAVLSPMAYGGFKLVEIDKPAETQPAA